MAGLDVSRLVLVRTLRKNDSGQEIYTHGTGYFITRDLILTAGHVLFPPPSEVKVRLETLQDGKAVWLNAEPVPVWLGQKIDAALLKIDQPIHEIELPVWGNTSFEDDVKWNSVAYPRAASEMTEQGNAYKSAGLTGSLYAHGGGGQGPQELELGVEHESKEQWNGISGAPVFVGDSLVGIIKSYKTGFEGKRLDAVPIRQLLNEIGFQRKLKPKWLDLPSQPVWTLILRSENSDDEFLITVRSALKRRKDEINQIAGTAGDTDLKFVPVPITEALKDAGRWYEMTEAVCKAPVMVVDVTDYQPAVMLLLGIRAVVRRGVTITATSTELDETLLSKLPFNIQETKLIYPQPDLEVADPRHPINRIGEAVVKGLTQARGYPGYLDLPAYEAVRCPKPQFVSGKAGPEVGGLKGSAPKGALMSKTEPERILMLCSFDEEYRKHWRYVSEKITLTFEGVGRTLERMLDISSPRLVGQALYESIRWTPCCIVDWTGWRANVFFELGVRLACSDIGPVSLIEEAECDIDKAPFSTQKSQLITLLQPVRYKLHGTLAPFIAALDRYHSFLQDDQENLAPGSAVPHDATYRTVVDAYDWRQEAFAKLPHEELRATIETQQSKDPQRDGFQALFSSNSDFKLEIQRSGRERWIAAWYYLKNRYTWEEFKSNEGLRQQLSALTENVVQELRELRNQTQPDLQHQRIYNEAVELIDKLDEL